MQWNELKTHLRHISSKDLQRIQEAFELGKQVHSGQKRKSGEPYFTHPIAVTHILADMGADADTLIAALLHDTVEDTELTLEEIDTRFNGDVVSLIDGVTKFEPEDVAETPTLDDQIETLRKMFDLMDTDVRVMVIKLVDRLHNMQTVEHLSKERATIMANETLDIYVKIADRFSMQDLRDELEGLCMAYLNPALYTDLQKLQGKNEKKADKAVEDIEEEFLTHEKALAERIDIIYERKPWKKLEEQRNAGDAAATGISPITAVFVCDDVKDCYAILGVLHMYWPRETLSFQDFINAPMINGYRGIHTTIIMENGLRIRCKIRTGEMHAYAREGITTMCFDSEASGALDYILPWTERISPLSLDTKQRSTEFWENLESDILGESIVMHGPNDEQILLPKDATALDGALYLYGKRALKCKEIRIDGKPVPFFETIPNASTVTATFTSKPTVELEWLSKVRTGIATALIREELAKAPRSQKVLSGKELLQKELKRKAHIGLNELKETSLQKAVQENFGIQSIEDLYQRVAEGKISTDDVVTTLFPQRSITQSSEKTKTWILDARYAPSLSDEMTTAMRHVKPRKLSFRSHGDYSSVHGEYRMNADQVSYLRAQLEGLLQNNQWSLRSKKSNTFVLGAISLLVMLWGLDPVFGHYLIQTRISPFDLTFVRFVVFILASTVYYAAFLVLNNIKLKPINPLRPSLLLSGISLFVTALFSYLTLTMMPATEYILFVVSMLVINTIFSDIRQGKNPLSTAIALALLITAGALIMNWEHISYTGIIFASISAIGFTLYSFISDRYRQEVEGIHARYPAFLFWLSLSIVPLIAVMPSGNKHMLLSEILGVTGLYVFVFSILPYAIYFECMKRVRMSALFTGLPIVCLWTLLGDILVNKTPTLLTTSPLILLSVALLVVHRLWNKERLT